MNSVVTTLVPVQYRCTQAVIFFLSSQTVLSVRLPVRSWYCVETNAFRKTFSPPGGCITHIFEPKKALQNSDGKTLGGAVKYTGCEKVSVLPKSLGNSTEIRCQLSQSTSVTFDDLE